MPKEIENFQKNFQTDEVFVENLAHFADSCTPKYSKNYAFFEKKSEIFYQKGLNNLKKETFVNAANDLFEALESEKKSISLKKNEATTDDIHYMGQIFESIGDIYNKVNSLKPASYFYDKALTEFKNAGRQHEVIDMLLKIGDLYQDNHIPNIALLNYETAESHRNLTESQLNDILIKKSIALYAVSDIETADSIFERKSQKSTQSIEYHYFAACHFYSHNEFEEALPHLKKCFEEGSNTAKLNAAEMLADVYFRMGDRSKELFYAQYQAKATSAEARLTPTKLELEAIYDKYVDENEYENENGSRRLSVIIWIILGFILLIIIGATITYIKSKKKKRENDQLLQDKVKIIDDKEKIIGDKEKIIDDISKKLKAANQTVAEPRSFDEDFKKFSETEIFKVVKNTLNGKIIMKKTVGDYPQLALSKTKTVTLTTKFNESLPNLTHTLIESHPGLTSTDTRHIILSIMGFSCLEIAVLMHLSYSTTKKRANHIQEIFGVEEDLEHFLPNHLRTIKY